MAMTWIENKRAIVTGATSGTGREVATALAALGAHVVLACRDRTRGEAVASEIRWTTIRAPRQQASDRQPAPSRLDEG